jgi:hypothetical protein
MPQGPCRLARSSGTRKVPIRTDGSRFRLHAAIGPPKDAIDVAHGAGEVREGCSTEPPAARPGERINRPKSRQGLPAGRLSALVKNCGWLRPALGRISAEKTKINSEHKPMEGLLRRPLKGGGVSDDQEPDYFRE